MNSKRYRIYGIVVESQLSFPHWPLATGNDTATDVCIRFQSIDQAWSDRIPSNAWYVVDQNQVYIRIEDVGQFLITAGKTVDYQPEGSHTENAWLYVEGAITGAILHQRCIWPLHASALLNPAGGVTAFIGHRGFGKSTLLYALHSRNHTVVADDIAAITFDESNRPMVHPGFPQGKLCTDAAERFGLNVSSLRAIQNPGRDKVAVPFKGEFAQVPAPLSEVYVLDRTEVDKVTCYELKGLDKLRQLSDNTYRLEFLSGDKDYQRLFQNVMAASHHWKVYRLSRPIEGNTVEQLADLIEERWNDQA